MNFDPVAIIREFGLSTVIVVSLGWVFVSFCKAVFPPIGSAAGRWIDAKTEEVQASAKMIREIPNVIAQNGKEHREALVMIEKAMMGSEGRIREDVRTSESNIKDEIHDDRQTKIDKNLERLAKRAAGIKDPDTDPAGSNSKK